MMPIQLADRRRPPHITINSGSGGDILAQAPRNNSSSDSISTRQLIPQPFASSPHSSGTSSPVYGGRQFSDGSELLLPRGRPTNDRPYRDFSNSDPYSTQSSRRTSTSSDGGGRYGGPFASPFDDRAGGPDDDNVNTQTVTAKYNCVPTPGLLVFPEDVEQDDEMHNPDPNEKEYRDGNIWTKRGAVNLGGLAFLFFGMLSLFIIWPVLYVESLEQCNNYSSNSSQNGRLKEEKCWTYWMRSGPELSIRFSAIIKEYEDRPYRPGHTRNGKDEDRT